MKVEGAMVMNNQLSTLVQPVSQIPENASREREQLRRELLRRIIDRHTRRQAMRGGPR